MQTELVLDTKLEAEKNIAWWLYLAHAVSFVLTLTALSWIPVIINFVKRGDTTGTFVSTHHSWQIRSFFWFWMLVAGAAAATIVGIPLAFLIGGLAWLWKAYRLIKGFVDLNANKAMPM